MALDEYRRKRDFRTTNEPKGRVASAAGDDSLSFVVQKHAASHLHYDFRLELDGVLKSWAVPKGPSLDPSVKRLAVHVEDHPLDYGGFEGIIPAGQYGGGSVMLWDRGTWRADGDAAKAYRKGRLKFELTGERLRGRWNLVRTRRADGNGKQQWLLIKEDDDDARPETAGDVTAEADTSVVSGRTMDEIAADADAEWQSNRPPSDETPAPKPRKRRSAREVAGGDSPAAADQPGARKAAFPKALAPELATLVSEVPRGDDWIHEIKYDGYRLVAFVRGSEVRLLTRRGNDWTSRFPAVAAALARFPADTAVIDGEVVVMDEHGVSSFQMLQNALGPGRGGGTLAFFAFDLPYLDGFALLETPLLARKALLRSRLEGTSGDVLRYSDHIAGSGPEFYRQACDWRLEGIISKRADSPYRSRRTKDWLKVKCTLRQEFVIGGFTAPRGSRSHFGALLVGVHDADGGLVYAGKVGTGFDDATLKAMYARLRPLEADESPFVDHGRKGRRPKDVRWVEPRLVGEVEFTEWTGEGQLRHPVFRGLREDKPAGEVVREHAASPPADADTQPVPTPAAEKGRSRMSTAPRSPSPPSTPRARRPKATRGETEVAGVRLTSPDRVLYADLGLTKLELARYYEQIADWVVPQVGGRALTLVRCPQGQGKQCFYQKHADDAFPPEIRRIPLKEGDDKKVVYTYVDSVQGIVSLVQLGVLEMHTWGSRVDRPERPDRIVMDLDPGPGVPWARVVESALHVRARLEELGFTSFVKATGGKGLHVVVPLVRRNDWNEVKAFTRALAIDVAARHPGRYVTKSTLSSRKGKIYIDYLRNARGATAIAAYSVRARPGAAIAVPLRWNELSPRLDTSRFTPAAVVRRLRSLKSDPWQELSGVKQSITRDVKAELDLE
jgi:bifunctional non-homologous end joining protein LigD